MENYIENRIYKFTKNGTDDCQVSLRQGQQRLGGDFFYPVAGDWNIYYWWDIPWDIMVFLMGYNGMS